MSKKFSDFDPHPTVGGAESVPLLSSGANVLSPISALLAYFAANHTHPYVSLARNVVAGNGMTGGGNLASDVTVTLGTPTTLTGLTSNLSSGTTHTHAISLTAGDVGAASILHNHDSVYPPLTRQIFAGDGMSGGGDLSVNRTLTLGTPGSLNGATTNAVAPGTHTHAISLTAANVGAPPLARLLTAGNGLTGGGDLSADRTLTLGTPSSLNSGTTNNVTGTTHTHAISLTAADVSACPLTRLLTAGVGLTGGGDHSADRTISMGTPSSLNSGTTNSATGTTHTHAISLTAADVGAPPTARLVSAGNGLTGGGSLAADRTLTLGTPSSLNSATTNNVTGTTHTHAISLTAADVGAAPTVHTHPISAAAILSLGTGLETGGNLSINVDNTKFNIAAGQGRVVDNTTDYLNPTFTQVVWSAINTNTLTNLATQNVTYITLTSAGTVVQYTAFPTEQIRRTEIFLGVIVHSNRTFINAVNNIPSVSIDSVNQLNDLMYNIGPFNVTGNVIVNNGANLKLNKSNGYIFRTGVNFQTDKKNPHKINVPTNNGFTFRYRTQLGAEGSDISDISPGFYDNAGTITAITAAQFTNQRVYVFPSGLLRIQYGQAFYSSLANAQNGLLTEIFVKEQNIADNGLLIGIYTAKGNASDLSNGAQAMFYPVSRFGDILSGASATPTTTLQQAYNNSVLPSITTTGAIGAVQIKGGTATATDNVFEVINHLNASCLRVDDGGRVYGTMLHNNAGAVTGSVNQYIASGTYSPTLTAVTNIAATTTHKCQWMRVGNVVTVSGRIEIDPTSASTLSTLGISLPIPSNFGNLEDAAGTARSVSAGVDYGGQIGADAANDRATLTFITASDVANQSWYFHFTYEILP